MYLFLHSTYSTCQRVSTILHCVAVARISRDVVVMHLHAYDMYNVVTSGSMTSDWRVVQTVNLADWNPGPSAKAADIVA